MTAAHLWRHDGGRVALLTTIATIMQGTDRRCANTGLNWDRRGLESLETAHGKDEPPMSAAGAALVAGMLGLGAGAVAKKMICRVAANGPARPSRFGWPVLEVIMAASWWLVSLQLVDQGLTWAVPAYLAVAFLGVVLAVVDATTQRLPNRITYPAFPVVAVLLLAASVGVGDIGRLGRGLLVAAAVGGFFLLLALLSPQGVGGGDVKLAPTLGLALGWLSWGAVVVGLTAAFLLGGVAGLMAVVVFGRSRRSLLPFGPWLVAGTLLGVLAGGRLAW
jgi:prepilin signal peptidase PulO-like enzyme (type II secretory pathway)